MHTPGIHHDRAAPRAILVIRLSAIGDVVMSAMVARALKQRWPSSRVVWLAEPAPASLVRASPYVDEVIVWDKAAWKALWRQRSLGALLTAFRALRGSLRRERFDWVLDLQGLFKSGVFAFLAGAPVRIGLGSKEGSGLFMTGTVSRASESRLIGAEYWRLVKALGAPLAKRDFQVPFHTGEDEAAVARLLAEHGVGRRYVVLCPFTTRPQKHWREERWAVLAAELRDRHGVDVVMLGSAADRTAADAIAAGAPAMRSLVGLTTLRQCAAVIATATLVIGVDTGLTHLGMVSSAPTFALFGSTLPYRELFKPADRVFYKNLHCSPCRRRPTCNQRYDCMREISVAEILIHAAAILEGPP